MRFCWADVSCGESFPAEGLGGVDERIAHASIVGLPLLN